MIRLFRVYYPIRTLVLLVGEGLVVWFSFLLGTVVHSMVVFLQTPERFLQFKNQLFIEGAYLKALQYAANHRLETKDYAVLGALTGIVLVLSHAFDLYDSAKISEEHGSLSRLLAVLGLIAIVLGALVYYFPTANLPALSGVFLLIVLLFAWRRTYYWLVDRPLLRDRVYVLGGGERAARLIRGLQERSDLGIDVVGWTGDIQTPRTREAVAYHMLTLAQPKNVGRVIVAMDDRRGTLPVAELLNLRMAGVRVEEATSWLEKIYGRIELEQLNPSWLIFNEGFQFSWFKRLARRILNLIVASFALLLSLPLLPFVALAVRLSSPGPVFYSQKRVGRLGREFFCYKFRTMVKDAEADTGATWAADDDPRITRVGRVLRFWRLDEIPQLWCVLKGDMHFVGPRPERPEFVNWLKTEIPYYEVRHIVRPGITGWAQVRYSYANTLEDSRKKLQYDLFYIKNASFSLDLWIMFQTIKIVVLGRGSKVKPLTTHGGAAVPRLEPEVSSER